MAWNEPGGNDKDPWGRRNNEQGPPDLDELIKKMQQKLGGIFGGSGGGGGGGSLNPKLAGAGVLFLLVVWAAFGWYTVQPAERGVELVFGRFHDISLQGLRWNFPYPVGRVIKVNVDEVRSVKHKALMLTQDENIVVIELEVQYNVKEADNYLFHVREPDNTLREATESALREVVGTSKMDDVLTSGRTAAASHTKALIQEILDRYVTGLVVRSVNMQNAQPPEAVQAAFADVIKAREDEERHKNTAEAYANEVVQRAGGLSDQLRAEANAYKAKVIAHASGEAQRFKSVLTEYEKAPEVTRQRLYLETMQNVLSNTSKVMVNTKGSNNLMYLPLDKLLEKASSSTKKDEDNEPDFTIKTVPLPSARDTNERSGRDDRRTR